ncbi:MAG TPA: hypothetical protein GX717_00640, partial [Clostridiaceae bacterium]|nr:hypothetical protein [Clostridiaceae bacterium]
MGKQRNQRNDRSRNERSCRFFKRTRDNRRISSNNTAAGGAAFRKKRHSKRQIGEEDQLLRRRGRVAGRSASPKKIRHYKQTGKTISSATRRSAGKGSSDLSRHRKTTTNRREQRPTTAGIRPQQGGIRPPSVSARTEPSGIRSPRIKAKPGVRRMSSAAPQSVKKYDRHRDQIADRANQNKRKQRATQYPVRYSGIRPVQINHSKALEHSKKARRKKKLGTKRKRRRLKRRGKVTIAAILITLMILIIWLAPAFRIFDVTVTGEQWLPREKILDVINWSPGTHALNYVDGGLWNHLTWRSSAIAERLEEE